MWFVKYNHENIVHQHNTFNELYYETLKINKGIPSSLVPRGNDNNHLKEIVKWWISKCLIYKPNNNITPFQIACCIDEFIKSILSSYDNTYVDRFIPYILDQMSQFKHIGEDWYLLYCDIEIDMSTLQH